MANIRRIGLIVGDESSWPVAFIQAVERLDATVLAELVKLEQVRTDLAVEYDVIVDRVSHKIPFYRAYLKFAVLQGCHVINNPFTWAGDDKFFGMTLVSKLGCASPRTLMLPNKAVTSDTTPESFRNLSYPLRWQDIVDYVGVPAILKDVHTGGRCLAVRVHSVDELIDQYDQSGTLTMVLQEVIEDGRHIHCFVVGGKDAMLAEFDLDSDRYSETEPDLEHESRSQMTQQALHITRILGYDVNMVEFIVREGQPIIINPSNPAPEISLSLQSPRDFQWIAETMARWAIEVAYQPRPPQNHTDWLRLIAGSKN